MFAGRLDKGEVKEMMLLCSFFSFFCMKNHFFYLSVNQHNKWSHLYKDTLYVGSSLYMGL